MAASVQSTGTGRAYTAGSGLESSQDAPRSVGGIGLVAPWTWTDWLKSARDGQVLSVISWHPPGVG